MNSAKNDMILAAGIMLLVSPFVRAVELPTEPFSNLKSEDFHKRETAQQQLLTWAREQHEQAADELYRQSRVADDPEVRERCLAVLKELVLDEYYKDGKGYIGIQMQDEIANVPGDPNPRAVIRVRMVVPDSGAAQAGILLNDLIVGLGDQIWHEGPASLPFGDKIKQQRPDEKVTLKVLRNGNPLDVEVKLGRRPIFADNLLFMGDEMADPDAVERAAKDAYFQRWLERRKLRN